MSALVHCIYTSHEAYHLSHAEVDALLLHSRVSNALHGITGVLLHVDGSFMQVLEGEAAQIDALYARILIDPRHTRITRIILEAIPHRFFGEWTMGLSQLHSEELAKMLEEPGTRANVLSSLSEGRAKKLLRAFTEGRWRRTIQGRPKAALL